jgi:hypothetical protein
VVPVNKALDPIKQKRRFKNVQQEQEEIRKPNNQ